MFVLFDNTMMGLKSFSYLLVVLIGVCYIAADDETPQILDECLKENNMDKEAFVKSRKPSDLAAEAAQPREFFCTIKCISEKRGELNDKGEFLEEVYKSNTHPGFLTADKNAAIFECFKKGSPIKTCEDMKAVRECIFFKHG